MTTELSSRESQTPNTTFVDEIRPDVAVQSSDQPQDKSECDFVTKCDKISFWLYLTITIIVGVLIFIMRAGAPRDSPENKAYLSIVECKISLNTLIATVLPLTVLFALIGNQGYTKLKGSSQSNFNIILYSALFLFFLWGFFLYLKKQPRTSLILLVLTIILIISNFAMVYCSNGDSSIWIFYLLTIVILIFLFIKTFEITNLFEKEIATEKW